MNLRRINTVTFNGVYGISKDGKIYNVPENYASKSKLLEGDILNIYLNDQGEYIFKQIERVPRKMEVGIVDSGIKRMIIFIPRLNRKFKVLKASESYFHLQPGMRVAVTIRSDENCGFCAIENLL